MKAIDKRERKGPDRESGLYTFFALRTKNCIKKSLAREEFTFLVLSLSLFLSLTHTHTHTHTTHAHSQRGRRERETYVHYTRYICSFAYTFLCLYNCFSRSFFLFLSLSLTQTHLLSFSLSHARKHTPTHTHSLSLSRDFLLRIFPKVGK